MPKGTVKWFDPKKGFGSIKKDSGGKIFFRSSSILGDMRLAKGDRVIFDIVETPKGPRAESIRTPLKKYPQL